MKPYDANQDGGLEIRELPFTSIEDHNSSLKSSIVSVESLAWSDLSTLATILECHPAYKPSPNIIKTPNPLPEALAKSKWRPSSLGTGLVYDWEFSDGPYTDSTNPAASKDLASLLIDFTPRGFHPIHLHAYMQGQQSRLASIWQKDDDSCYKYSAIEALSKESVEIFVNDWKKLTYSFRVVSIAAIIPYDKSKALYSISLIEDKQYTSSDWGIALDISISQFFADVATLKISQKRIVSFTVTVDEQKIFALPRFSYVWTGLNWNPIIPWKIESITLPASGQSIVDKINAQIATGWAPVCMDSWYANGTGSLLVLYAEHQAQPNPGLWFLHADSTPSSFSSFHNFVRVMEPTRQLVAFATYQPTPSGPPKAIGIWRFPLERFLDVVEKNKATLPLTPAAKFEEKLTDFMKAADVPYAAMAVFKDDKIVLERAYRWGPKSLNPITVDSLFRLASTAKIITVLGILKALEEKAKDEFSLYNPGEVVSKIYLDYRAFVDFPGMPSIANHPQSDELSKITVRNLLRHNSGFPGFVEIGGMPAGTKSPVKWKHESILKHLHVKPPFPAITRNQILSWMLNSNYWSDGPNDIKSGDALYKTGFDANKIGSAVGDYSNVGYIFLEKLIEAITGHSYVDYVYNKILVPVGASSMKPIQDARYFVDDSELLHSADEAYLGDKVLGGQSIGPSILGAWTNSSLYPTDVYGGSITRIGVIRRPYLGAGGWVGSIVDVIRMLGALRDFKINPLDQTQKKGLVDLEGGTLLEYETVAAMMSTEPEVIDRGTPMCLGWYATSHNALVPPIGSPSSPLGPRQDDVQIRWFGGDMHGAHCRFSWREDGTCFCYALSRRRPTVTEVTDEDDVAKVTGLFIEFNKIAKTIIW